MKIYPAIILAVLPLMPTPCSYAFPENIPPEISTMVERANIGEKDSLKRAIEIANAASDSVNRDEIQNIAKISANTECERIKEINEIIESAKGESARAHIEEIYMPRSARIPAAHMPSPPSDSVKKNDVRKHFYVGAGYLYDHMRYKEITKNTSTVLDEDIGNMDGLYLTLGYKSDNYVEWIQGKPFIDAYYQHYGALIAYKGATMGGTPVNFDDEHANIQQFGVKIGAYRELSERGTVFGYLDIGRRIWYRGQNRVVNGTLDYAEKYWWTYIGAGTGFTYRFSPRLLAGADLEVMYAPETLSWMRADLRGGGTFELGMVLGAQMSFPFRYYITKNISVDLTPYFQCWEINESVPTMISGTYYYEPYSRTYIKGILAGITYSF